MLTTILSPPEPSPFDGQYLRVAVIATNAAGDSTVAYSNVLGPVTAAAVPTNTVAPIVSGSTLVGDTLSCTTGTWTESPTAYSYQWQQSPDGLGSWTNTGGATASTYVSVIGDVGHLFRCQVIALNASGQSTVSNSNVVGPIIQVSAPSVLPTSSVFVHALVRLGFDPNVPETAVVPGSVVIQATAADHRALIQALSQIGIGINEEGSVPTGFSVNASTDIALASDRGFIRALTALGLRPNA